MREHGHATHDGLDRIRINDAFLDTGDEKRRLAAFELIVEVDEEGKERGLSSIFGGGVVLVRVCYQVDAGRWPCTV
jgi:urease alpha subunit